MLGEDIEVALYEAKHADTLKTKENNNSHKFKKKSYFNEIKILTII